MVGGNMTYKENIRSLLSSMNTKEELLLTFLNIKTIPITERIFKEEFMRIELNLIEKYKILQQYYKKITFIL